MNTIIVDGQETASQTSVLTGTRLLTVGTGLLIVEFIANLNDATNNFVATLQLPNGDNPFSSIQVPGVNPSLTGVMDERMKFMASYRISDFRSGAGHVVLAFVETGAAILYWRVTHKAR